MSVATYVYAVRRCGGAEVHVPGHPGGSPVRLLPFGALVAVVQDVPAEDFTEEAMRRRLADPAELERCARTHHAIVTACADTAPTVPLPLATLYANDVRARAALEEHEERFGAALHRLAGHVEWAVKVHRDGASPGPGIAPGPAPAAEPAEDPGASGDGRSYLRQVRERQRQRDRHHEQSLDVADLVDRTVRSLAVAAVRRRPHGVEVTGRDRPQVMNAAYLLAREDHVRLSSLISTLEADPRLRGYAVETSGPWVPYSFANDEDPHGETV
ncbi:GvpL/GvpF family gas vesicle protein [Streptomyces sp. NPDC049954]|uniref:GvpL/GvpF family gas vesicle protein n=1 Tax=Streptomyces sp. NPDC049954 TaxID=3155779 RepID=UPI00341AD38B